MVKESFRKCSKIGPRYFFTLHPGTPTQNRYEILECVGASLFLFVSYLAPGMSGSGVRMTWLMALR